MATVTLKRIKKTDLLGKVSFKDTKTYFSPSLSIKTGERIKVLSDEEAKDFALKLNLPEEELKNSSSNFWRDYTFIMQGGIAELDDTESSHQLALKMLEKDSRIAISEEDQKKKSKAEYILVKETEVTENKVKRRAVKAEAYSKYSLMSDDDLQNVLLAFGKNPKDLSANKIKELVSDELETNPDKFLSMISDKQFKIKVFINDLVQEGVVRKSGTGYIYDGEMIAHDTLAMIEFLKNPKNDNFVIAFKKMLNSAKSITKYKVD